MVVVLVLLVVVEDDVVEEVVLLVGWQGVWTSWQSCWGAPGGTVQMQPGLQLLTAWFHVCDNTITL